MTKRILFVCLGNICRSPVAEGIMLHLALRYGLDVEIDSAGTSGYHRGEGPDYRTVKNALKNGFDLSTLKARQFEPADFDRFDQIYVMDKSNLQHVKSLCSNKIHFEKISLLPHPELDGQFIEIPDPYYGEEAAFENVFNLIYKTCEKLCQEIKKA